MHLSIIQSGSSKYEYAVMLEVLKHFITVSGVHFLTHVALHPDRIYKKTHRAILIQLDLVFLFKIHFAMYKDFHALRSQVGTPITDQVDRR